MVVISAAKSDIGRQRNTNEDAFYVDSSMGLYIICDGVGGHVAGEVASNMAIEFATDYLCEARVRRVLPQKADPDFRVVWSRLVVESIESCCDQLYAYASSHTHLDGMATTITIALIVEDVAFVGHVGDCRLYLKRGEIITQLTRDHTLLEDLSSANQNRLDQITSTEQLKNFRHVLTRCAGRERDFEVEAFHLDLSPSDRLLLCSDGLSNYFADDPQICELLSGETVQVTVESMIEFANIKGGHDNITAIVIECCDRVPSRVN